MVRASVAIVIVGAAACAQQPSAPASDSVQVGGITLQGSIRTRPEFWSWFEADSGTNQYAFLGDVLKISGSRATDSYDWQVEFELSFLLGLPSDAVAPGTQGQLGLGGTYYVSNNKNSNTAMLFPKQAFYRWKNLGGVAGQSLRMGRFESAEGAEHTPKNTTLAALKAGHINQRLIGPFGFTNTGQSFDGVQYIFDRAANNFTVWGAVPDRGAFQTDGWGWLKIAFGYAAYTREWGKGRHSAETRFFGIEYYDYRNILKVDNRPLAVRESDTASIRINTFGGHSLHAIDTKAGTVDLLAWGAVQTGQWGLERQRASAFVGEVGFQPTGFEKIKPWLRAGYTMGSGSGNPNGPDHGTFFQMLPTARIYARFPFFNMMNIQDRYGALVLRPTPKLSISPEYHSLGLSNTNDLWYSGGGPYQPWSFGFTGRNVNGANSLANLYDAQADYRINPAVSMALYFGYAQGLAGIRAVYPRGPQGQYGFVELTYRFLR